HAPVEFVALRSGKALAGDHGIQLMDGDFLAVDLGGDLRERTFLLAVGASCRQQGQEQTRSQFQFSSRIYVHQKLKRTVRRMLSALKSKLSSLECRFVCR